MVLGELKIQCISDSMLTNSIVIFHVRYALYLWCRDTYSFVLRLLSSLFCLSLPRAAALQLPDAVTLHLHVIKDCVYAYDYNGCLQNFNAMVSGGSFAMLADFLPGIKVLVQVAMQLGIYLERQ